MRSRLFAVSLLRNVFTAWCFVLFSRHFVNNWFSAFLVSLFGTFSPASCNIGANRTIGKSWGDRWLPLAWCHISNSPPTAWTAWGSAALPWTCFIRPWGTQVSHRHAGIQPPLLPTCTPACGASTELESPHNFLKGAQGLWRRDILNGIWNNPTKIFVDVQLECQKIMDVLDIRL